MNYAPIVVFAFNRLNSLKACINALQGNSESLESDLIVFVDGPRKNKKGEQEIISTIREYVETISGFKSLTTHFSDVNKGLANSIITGTTDVINQYGKVIVLEDDLVVAPGFLSFINLMLTAYEKDKRIMQVSGYSSKIKHAERYHCDFYLSGRAHSWSWGTWKDRWDTVDWEVKDFDELSASIEKQRSFCEYGSDLFDMLKGWHNGKNNSWYVRFDYAMHKQGCYCIAPIRSLVKNDGFGPGATHTVTYNRYKIDFNVDTLLGWQIPKELEFNRKLAKHAVRYWSIPYRIYGKLMGLIRKLWT
jgi:hypothetical protein